jgi:hypothetical protein
MKTQRGVVIEMLYDLAKAGGWDRVLLAFDEDAKLAGKCSRFRRASSGWTFLHQAAHFGHDGAARALIRLGGSLTARSTEGETAAEVARRRGHDALARVLEAAGRTGDDLWEPSPDAELLPSSCAWDEQSERQAAHPMKVAYGGGVVVIPQGARYFVDAFDRVVIGWHGSYDPPGGM